MPDERDAIATTLEQAAVTAEDSAREQQRAAGIARQAARALRREGRPVDGPHMSGLLRLVLDMLAASVRRLAAAAGALRRTWAAALATNGASIRRIGDQLGVSHQRVSALLTHHRNADTGPQP